VSLDVPGGADWHTVSGVMGLRPGTPALVLFSGSFEIVVSNARRGCL
jgi:hypothetical protein